MSQQWWMAQDILTGKLAPHYGAERTAGAMTAIIRLYPASGHRAVRVRIEVVQKKEGRK